MRFFFGIIFLLLLSLISVKSQSGGTLGSAYEGKHFLLGFMQNEIDDYDLLTLQIIIVSSYPADIVVNIPGENPRYYSISADSIQKIDIRSDLEIVEVERIVQKSIEIISTVPILVYTFNSRARTSDCFTAVPISQWGTEYVAMSFPNDQYWSTYQTNPYPDYLIPRKSEFLVLAAENDTKVTITPKSMTNSKRSQNIPFNVTLNKGDTYLVQSYDFQIGQGDLTGSIIRSTKPVGVISGHMRTAVPQFMNYLDESKDHLAVMLTPTSSWARQFYSIPYGQHGGGDLFRVTGGFDNTMVTVESVDTVYNIFLDKIGSFATIPAVKKATKWTSNHPVQIGQYMMRIGGDEDNDYYDPCLVILPPAEQFISKMIFQTVGGEPGNYNQYLGYGILLIVEESAIPSLKLDNEYVENLDDKIWDNKFPNSTHRWTRLPVAHGKHSITCDVGHFSGIAYGYGFADSYSVILGSSLSNPYSGDTITPVINVDEYCSNISGTISEVVDDSSSGLLFVYMSDRSYNFHCDINPKLFDDVDEVFFTAKPIDNLQNGRLIIEYRDKNGNGGNYEYIHFGVGLGTRDTIDFREVAKGDSICYRISCLASGNRPVILDSVKLAEPVDKRLNFDEIMITPSTLVNGDRYDYMICFAPKNSFNKLKQKLYYYFDCGRYDSTIIIGSVMFPELTVIGYDFGDICLADTAEGVVKIFNKGNVSIIINHLDEIAIDNQFRIDTLDINLNSIFPLNINPNDSISLKVYFNPESVGNFADLHSANNNLNIPNEIALTGNGIAPYVESVEIDWGKRRVGTINDTSFHLFNLGECVANIDFLEYEINDVAFISDEITLMDNLILPKDSLSVLSSFQPNLLVKSELRAKIKVDSPLHQDISITMTGEGTMPVIEPIRIDFDTVYIYSTVDTVANIIFNSGNEKLWFDYKQTVGDDSCFSINYSLLKEQFLGESNMFSIPITFSPLKIGYNEIAMVINHDAYPAYNKGDTVVIISGIAKPLNIIKPEISFENDVKYLPCNDNIFNLRLTNNGNFDLRLDSLLLLTTDIVADWETNPELPLLIAPEGFEDFRLTISPQADKKGYIQLKTVFNDTIIYLSENYLIEERIYPIEVNNPGLLEYTIGNEAYLPISGRFPHHSELPVGFEFDINLDARYMYLLNNNSVLKVVKNADTVEYIMGITQSMTKVSGRVFDEITVSDSSEWFFELKFLVLLSDSRTTKLEIKVNSDICFSPGELILNPIFLGVCQFDIRKIELTEKKEIEVFLYPNPVSEELCIKINLLRDSWLNLSIFDQNGKKNALYENLNLKKGLHSLIFEISPMASGIYILSAMTESGVENIMFIINK